MASVLKETEEERGLIFFSSYHVLSPFCSGKVAGVDELVLIQFVCDLTLLGSHSLVVTLLAFI